MNKASLAIAVLTLLVAGQLAAETIEGLTLHTQKLGERGLRLWLGDHATTTAVAALATRDGVVVIDTTDMPKADARFREIIARELGTDDFTYLILTHEHGDHWRGAKVWADCQVVAHERALQGMTSQLDDLPGVIEWTQRHIQEMEGEIATAGSDEEKAVRTENLLAARARLAGLEPGAQPPTPDITFSDRLTLDMGDMSLELSYSGGIHSASDIFVFVPEEGLLFTGDVMADIWYTDQPGCLAGFRVRPGVAHDFPLLLESWASLLARKGEIKDLIPGHWNGDISLEGFERRHGYVKTLWEGIGAAVENGTRLDDLYARFGLQANFPGLVDSPGFSAENHAVSIFEIWREITGAESAAAALARAIDARGTEQAMAEIRAAHASGAGNLYFLEHELNALGYQYLNQQKLDQALAVLELNAELYPASWNVWDSLAEAHMIRGDRDRAVELYQKSIAMNPDNQNGKTMLERLATAGEEIE